MTPPETPEHPPMGKLSGALEAIVKLNKFEVLTTKEGSFPFRKI